MSDDVASVKKNISAIYQRKKNAALALCLEFVGIALQYVRGAQASNTFWTNQTGSAKDLLFGGTISTAQEIGLFLAHGVEYGVYLELANNRKNAALFPAIVRYYARFAGDLEELYGGVA